MLKCLFTLHLFLFVPVQQAFSNEISGELITWHRVSVTFNGPQTSEHASKNPFTDYRLMVTFTHVASGATYKVPGFYAADGQALETGAGSGNKWRVHFTPDIEGIWIYEASFRTGNNVALGEAALAGNPASFDGASGRFEITVADELSKDFKSRGMLRYVNGYHLQYAGSKDYFLKTGPNGPENLLAYADFDGTYDTVCSNDRIDGSLHYYEPHVKDWQQGDPSWMLGKGKGLIGAINYLSSVGLNSLYFLTYNIDGGDGCDVWPWADEKDKMRYDVSKLAQWEAVFAHMDAKGIQLHVVLSERQNAKKLGSNGENGGVLNDTRKLYYRELIARFGHHLALQWNLGEENNNNDTKRKEFAEYIRRLDPYNHPIAVHTSDKKAFTFYEKLLGHSAFESTSLQADIEDFNKLAIHYREASEAAGRKWSVYADEQAPNAGNNRADQLRKFGLWGNLMGGGAGIEWYFSKDLSLENFRKYDALWYEMQHAHHFFQAYLPFSEMGPANTLTAAPDDYVLAKPGDTYAVYNLNGGVVQIDLAGNTQTYKVRWYNPRSGGALLPGKVEEVEGGGLRSLGAPPTEPERDWVVLVSSTIEEEDDIPVVEDQPIYRVNGGGSGVFNSALAWSRDTKNKPSPFVNVGGAGNKTAKNAFTGINETGAPTALFDRARWDPNEGTGMQWDFPVKSAGSYLVKLYFAETSRKKKGRGKRIFDVFIEESHVLKDFDVVADAGFQVATEKVFLVSVLDGNLDIDFAQVTDHPFVNAIEVVAVQEEIIAYSNVDYHKQKRTERHEDIDQQDMPAAFILRGNYPNPFYTSTTIVIDLPSLSEIRVDVFDVMGRRVKSLLPGVLFPGYQREIKVYTGMLPSGTYVYRVVINGNNEVAVQSGRLVILK